MIKRRFTIGQLMLAIAAVALEFGLLPAPVAAFAACLTLALPLIPMTQWWGAVAFSVLGLAVLGLVLPVTTRCVFPRSSQCANNLRQVSLALQAYRHEHGCFPPSYVADAKGRPLYSWRVLILPYLDQQDLYVAFNLSEPWDSPNNLPISDASLRIFACPEGDSSPRETSYLAVIGPGTAFPGVGTVTEADLRDGASTTIVLVEVAGAKVRWAEPRDLDVSTMSLSLNDPTRLGISGFGAKGPAVAFADGSVTRLGRSLPPKTLKALLTIDGGETIDVGELGR